jgi:crotonobetainyl-CoA:carnitine CoA-transferase CaiB-like acyl-CoA transferase
MHMIVALERIAPSPSSEAVTPPELPLQGVRVVELCWVWAGPLLGQLLADLGAEVIKCEWYTRHDPYRTRGIERLRGQIPKARHRESSFSFHSLNRNKVGFAADLKTEEGLDQVKQVIAASDLLIENFTVGTLARLGLDYDVLLELNDRLAVLSLSGFGKGSPLEAMRAYGLVISALGGAEAEIRDGDQFLGSPTFVISDPNAAAFGLFTAIAALLHAEAAGKGAAYLFSQVEAVVALMEARATRGTDGPTELVVQARDERHVAVAAMSEADAREAHTLSPKLDADQLVLELTARGIPATPVIGIEDTLTSPVFAGTSVRLTAQHPVTGPESLVAAPWLINGRRAPLRKPAPVLGEGDEYVLRTIVGLSDEEVARRRQREQDV